MEKPNLERVGSMIQENVHRALMRQNPYSAACLEVYLYRKRTGSAQDHHGDGMRQIRFAG